VYETHRERNLAAARTADSTAPLIRRRGRAVTGLRDGTNVA